MKKKPFTLLELSAAMAVLVIFMFFVMRFYNTSQDVMNRSTGKTDQYERARIIMDMLSYDLQNIYYTEGSVEKVYFQTNGTSGGDAITQDLSFYALRPHTTLTSTPGAEGAQETKTDLTWVTYHFDKNTYTIKMGIAGDDLATTKWNETPLSGSDLGVLADGVYRFRVIPLNSNDVEITLADLTSSDAGKPRIPDHIRIELQLLDGDTASAIKRIQKVPGMSLPKTLDPSDDDFAEKDKIRTFFRIVDIDRGQN